MKTKTVLLWAVVLFVIDQTVKIVIDQYFLDVRFDILPPLFYFRPIFNHDYTWINGLFNLGMGYWAHILMFCFAIVIMVVVYDLFKTISNNAKIINIAFIFAFATAFSALIGTIIWGGCLDYIHLKPLVIFDLKDLYMNIFLILFFLHCIKNRKPIKEMDKDVSNHLKSRFTSLIGKLKSKMLLFCILSKKTVTLRCKK